MWLNRNARSASDSSFFNPTMLRVTLKIISFCSPFRSYQLTSRIDIKRLLASRRMSSDDRVLILHWLPPYNSTTISAELRLLKSRVHRLQSVQPLLQRLRQTIVRLHLAGKQGIAADLRRVEKSQKCYSRGLSFVGNIGMPAHSTGAVSKERVDLAASWSVTVHNVKLGVALWTAARRVDVMAAEIGTKVKLLLGWDIGKVLVTESYNLALGNEECELVSSCGGKFA